MQALGEVLTIKLVEQLRENESELWCKMLEVV
jgi:hypothetical protein